MATLQRDTAAAIALGHGASLLFQTVEATNHRVAGRHHKGRRRIVAGGQLAVAR